MKTFNQYLEGLDPYEALRTNPEEAARYYYQYGKPEQLQDTIEKHERSLLKSEDPLFLSRYVASIKKERWPEAEGTIKTHPRSAYWYAKNVMKGRWPEAENIIKTDPASAYNYAEDIIKGRWPEAESEILKDPKLIYNYALKVLKRRWDDGERILIKEATKKSWPEVGPAYEYARDVIKGRWPEIEEALFYSPQHLALYARDVMKGRWPEAEHKISSNSNSTDMYVKDILHPWLKVHPGDRDSVIKTFVTNKYYGYRQFLPYLDGTI